MSARVARAWGVVGLLSIPVLQALAQAPAAPAAPAAGPPPVATVGTRRIERAEFDMRFAAAERQFEGRPGGPAPAELRDVLRRQLLETLIRLNLLVLESGHVGITVSGAEAESALKRDAFFSPGGTFDARRWQLARTSEPGRFAAALASAREQVAARRLDERVQTRFQPDAAALREQAMRQLRRAHTEDLSLRTADFNGNISEPRESEILAEYRTHADHYRRPDRATLSVVFVNEPPRTQAEVDDPAKGAAWTARMKRAADSLVASVRAGQTLEEASATYGGPRGNVSVLRDNFPGYWRGDDAQASAVFQASAGATLAPVPGSEGWLVVRVDDLSRAHVAPLRDVAREIRARLRDDVRTHRDERERRELYAQLRDSLAGPAWSFRWAAIDTGNVRIPEPTTADLDRWYRAHLADFSSFDSRSGTIVARTFDQVKDEARARWKRDRRLESVRIQSTELYEAWSAGRRAGAIESAVKVRETKPAPLGANVDTGFAAIALSDTVWGRGEPQGAGLAAYARGFLVWQVTNRIDKLTPSFEQVEPTLQVAIDRVRREADERGARRLFDQDPKRFGAGKRFHFTRMTVNHPALTDVKLTRAEVERWHRRNLTKYSAPELVRAKHILITPIQATAAADRAARVRADSLMARLRAGDDFDALAARFSDDPATKDKGGDLGVFARGTMLSPFEDAAFAMQEGELAGPVKTDVGYHLIRCTEHVPAYVQPLKIVYSIVATDLAHAQADTIAFHRADSLLRVVRTVAQAKAAGQKLGLSMDPFVFGEEETMDNTSLVPYFDRVLKMKAGELMPVKWIARGDGYWITWVDSITPAIPPSWQAARDRALAAYRAGAGERAMLAKTAELDSMLASGWTLDSLATLWGGLQRSKELAASGVRERESLPAALDSLVFGDKGREPALRPGEASGWVRWPGGVAKVRLLDRADPPADRLRVRAEELRRIALERKLLGYYEDLKRRWPVRIRDRSLAAIPLPEPPPEE